MKEFKHYGRSVIKQVADGDFRIALKSNKVAYTDLPVVGIDADVIRYNKDDATKYAILQDKRVAGEFWQAVYITESIPDDCDWERLIEDVNGQEHGEEPMQMTSKLKTILDMAEDMAREHRGFDDILKMSDSVSAEEFGPALLALGYNKDKLQDMDAYDVDSDFLKDIMGWLA